MTGVAFPGPPRRGSAPRVVVTGAGIVSPLGLGWQANAEGFRTGRTAFRAVSLFDVSRQRVQSAAEVNLPARLPPTFLSSRQEARLDRASRLLLLAAHEVWTQSPNGIPDFLPVVLGTSSGGMSTGQKFYQQAVQHPGKRRRQMSRVVAYQAQQPGLDLGAAFGFEGPVTIIANACASGSNAIGHGWHLIRSGMAERVLAGGYDALSQLVFAGFDSLQALSPTHCRPFDVTRDGLSLGEGAAVLFLENLESAQRHGARILAEVAGYGASTDSHHLTQPQPQGRAALASMSAACREAGLEARQIDYLNAHGTGTLLNDSAEAFAINQWAGDHAPALRVSSTKAGIGHLLGAAGAVEAVICLMALREQWLPPTPATRQLDPIARFQWVQKPDPAPLEHVLSNSFGFGGANASLIFKRWK